MLPRDLIPSVEGAATFLETDNFDVVGEPCPVSVAMCRFAQDD